MPEDGGATAEVVESPVQEISTEVSTQPIEAEEVERAESQLEKTEQEKLDGRKQPDQLRKRIADLKRQAGELEKTDPVAAKALREDAKRLNDTVGKAGAYEQLFPTVREAREFKALLDSYGGRDGLVQMAETLSNVEEIDALLEKGDPAVIDKLWAEGATGVQKIIPHLVDRLAKENPEAYTKIVSNHAIQYFDKSGFPEAFDQMTELVKAGKSDEALALAAQMAKWYSGQRNAQSQEPKTDPEVDRLRKELEQTKTTTEQKTLEAGYNGVADAARPLVYNELKGVVGRLGLSKEQLDLLAEDTWKFLENQRNNDSTCKTVTQAKFKSGGVDAAMQVMKDYTAQNVKEAARKTALKWYGHQLKNGAQVQKKPDVTKPIVTGVIKGEMPKQNEIDYGPKGAKLARDNGFRSVQDMILSGRAPLLSGGVRQWR